MSEKGGKVGERVRMTIDGVAFGGDGVARPEGLVTFVPFTVDGDDVVVEITERRDRYARGVLREVLSPSPHRVAPPCPHYGRCGGCTLQHVAYSHQLSLKEGHVREAFSRIGRFPEIPLLPAVPSPRPFGYRGRAEIHVRYGGGREAEAGFMARGSHTLLHIDRCLLLAEGANEALSRLRRSLASRARGPAREGQRLIWSGPEEESPGGDAAVRFVRRTVRGAEMKVPPRGFFQANELLVDALVDTVLEMAAPAAGDRVLDAYSGSGLFSRFLAPRAASIVGIEQDREAVACARENLREAGFPGARFREGDVAEGLHDLAAGTGERIDVAVLDPPRTGCAREVLAALVELSPGRIVYVSCDPATQARDARYLADRGYDLRVLRPVDMFPQTSHVESVALFLNEK